MNKQKSIDLLQNIGQEVYTESIYTGLQQYWVKALSPDNPLWQFVESKAFTVDSSAHLLAMQDNRNKQIGFIGFYEAIEQVDTQQIIQDAVVWLKERGVKKIVSTFDGSIIQNYRFNQDADQAFFGEPTNPSYYIDNFSKYGFKPMNHYVSGIRSDFNTILPYVETDLGEYSIRQVNPKNIKQDMKIIYDIAMRSFENTSEYFVHFTWQEFWYWYETSIAKADLRYIEILYHKQEPIGMCYSFVEGKQLIMKTIGVIPEYQGQGVSRFLAFSQHTKAKEDKLESVIYALIRTGNVVSKMPYPGVEIFRKYQTLAL